jgi:ribosome-associated toxin RatA of RatAB toxin-antitoxin module
VFAACNEDVLGVLVPFRYVSKVNLQAPRLVRSTVADSMLFHHLDSSWRMEPGPTPHTCWLTFEVDFAFNSVLYTHLADMFFSEVSDRAVIWSRGVERGSGMYAVNQAIMYWVGR